MVINPAGAVIIELANLSETVDDLRGSLKAGDLDQANDLVDELSDICSAIDRSRQRASAILGAVQSTCSDWSVEES